MRHIRTYSYEIFKFEKIVKIFKILKMRNKLTVRTMISGGFIGYSGGTMILPWYTPP